MSRSLGFQTGKLFLALPSVPGSLAARELACQIPQPQSFPVVAFPASRLVGTVAPCPAWGTPEAEVSGSMQSWGHWATSPVLSPLSQAASPLASLLNLQAKWTSCCGKPWFQWVKQSSAGESCHKACKHCSCCLAQSRCQAARCPAKRGTSFTLRAAGFLTRAAFLLGRKMPGNTVLSSWDSTAAPCLPNRMLSGSKSDYHSKFSQEEGHFLIFIAR